jgi:hypothetical protein
MHGSDKETGLRVTGYGLRVQSTACRPRLRAISSIHSLVIGCFVIVFLLLVFPHHVWAVWPLSWELGREKNYLGPLVSYDKEDENERLTIRPFFSHDSAGGGSYSLLWPLGSSENNKSQMIPFYTHHAADGEEDTSILLFFWGKSKEKSYGGFFPFYGQLYNRFGKDEMGFFLWPIYSYVKSEGATRTNVLWPFFSVSSGTEDGFKFWPFYGYRNRGEEKKSSFALWPVFHWGERDADLGDPKKVFWAFPFYMRTTSRTTEQRSVLFPFFSYYKSPERESLAAPWPFYFYTKGEEENTLGIWPPYTHRSRGKDNTYTYLWPVYRDSEWYVKDQRYVDKRLLIYLGRYSDDDRGKFATFWPLFEYRDSKEKAAFFFPSLLPFRNEKFDRIVKPLITLYEYRREGSMRTSNYLYGFYTKEEKGESWKRRLAFLFELKKAPEGYGFELLSGLFAVDPHRVKVFFIPIKRAAGDGQLAAKSGQTPVTRDECQGSSDECRVMSDQRLTTGDR